MEYREKTKTFIYHKFNSELKGIYQIKNIINSF